MSFSSVRFPAARSALVALAAASAPIALLSIGAAACGSSRGTAGVPDMDAGPGLESSQPDRPDLPDTLHPDGPCAISIDTPPLLSATHVPVGTDITWSSNPPSSGPHYPVWAAYQAYTSPVPRGYYVHDEEHGAVVLLYNCSAGSIDCAAVQAQLAQVAAALPDDPLCTALNQGVRVRVVITPDPLLDVPVAAAAWGWTYRAQCLDVPSLVDFARAHYGDGRESVCDNGQTTF